MLLDDIGFVWDYEGLSRQSSSRKAIKEIARHKTSNHEQKCSSESNNLDIDMIDAKNHGSDDAVTDQSLAENQSAGNEVIINEVALDHATVEVDETSMDNKKEDIKIPVPAVKPNLEFFRRSIGSAVWLAQGASELVKIFVSF
jgi:hypothetical protein